MFFAWVCHSLATHKVPCEERLTNKRRLQERHGMKCVGMSRTEMSGGILLVLYDLRLMLIDIAYQSLHNIYIHTY